MAIFDMYLVNRSQREVTKTVGQPAQRPDLETFSKDVFHRFDGLHQQLERLHAVLLPC